MANKFQGKFGMYEMEVAAEIIMNKIKKYGIKATISYRDFEEGIPSFNLAHRNDPLTGFCELLFNGWLDRWMYNGTYTASNKFLERAGYDINSTIS